MYGSVGSMLHSSWTLGFVRAKTYQAANTASARQEMRHNDLVRVLGKGM